MIKNKKAFTLIELIIVMAIMAILATTLLTLIKSAGSLYQNSTSKTMEHNEARLCLSYIEGEIRRNDKSESINILPSSTIISGISNNSEILRIVRDLDIEYIYYNNNDNYIYSGLDNDKDGVIDSNNPISKYAIRSFSVKDIGENEDIGTLEIIIGYYSDNEEKELKTTITLRSD